MRASYVTARMSVTMMAIAGCTATPATQLNSAASPGPAVATSWDGTYRGAVQITGLGSGVQQQWCETDPQIAFQVTNNAFSYAMPHPNAPNNPTPVYSATIASDGSFRSSLASGTMTGRVTGTHISGKIDGSVCVYSFALDRSLRATMVASDAGPAQQSLTRANLKTPRAAAIAGIVFSLLLITSLWLLRLSIPSDPLQVSAWMEKDAARVTFALNLVPFAGIAFMWFLGVLRDRLGAKEDKFFATVFLGSGLMFLGMLFVAASAIGSLVLSYTAAPGAQLDASSLTFARKFAYDIMHIYAFKMAAVFMITTSTLSIYTRVTARWIAMLGYASAAVILIGSGFVDWLLFVFPCWVLVVSIYVLTENLRRAPQTVAAPEG